MKDIMNFLATREVLIVLGILAIILVIYVVFWAIEFWKKRENKKKLKNNTMELNRLVEEVKEAQKKEQPQAVTPNPKELEKQEVKQPEPAVVPPVVEEPAVEVTFEKQCSSPVEVQPVIVKPEPPKAEAAVDNLVLAPPKEKEPEPVIEVLEHTQPIEKIEYKEEVYTKTEAQAELERLTEELQQVEQEDKNATLTEFEIAQEENAIISLEELLAKGKTLIETNEVTQYQDEGNEPISIAELEQRYQQEQQANQTPVIEATVEPPKEPESVAQAPAEQVVLYDMHTAPYQNTTGYKPSPIISPIYGIEPEHIAKPTSLELENTANYEKLDEEIRKTNEFLSKLRELQKKLD